MPFSEEAFYESDAVFAIISIKGGGNWKVIGVFNNQIMSQEGNGIVCQKRYWQNRCQNSNIWVGTYKMPADKFTDKDRSDFQKMLLKTYEL